MGAGRTNKITLSKIRAEQRAEQTATESGVRIWTNKGTLEIRTRLPCEHGEQTDHGILEYDHLFTIM